MSKAKKIHTPKYKIGQTVLIPVKIYDIHTDLSKNQPPKYRLTILTELRERWVRQGLIRPLPKKGARRGKK